MTPLRKRMIQDLRLRNYSPKTIEAYTHCVAAFANHFGKPPQHLGPPHIRQYQIFLVEEKKVAWGTFNQIVCALRFLYRVTLGKKDIIEQIPFPRKEKRLPVVLSTTELGAFFNAVGNLKCRTALMTMYAAGLRLSEALTLRISDIDSDRNVIRVRQGKGKRDRYVLLSPTLLSHLRQYRKAYKPKSWLFPGRDCPIITCRPPRCKRSVLRLAPRRVSTNPSPHTPCGTASPLICWKQAPICAKSSSCSATAALTPRPSTYMWQPAPSGPKRNPWTCSAP
jgi:integrase/recombinase XerD